MVQGVLCVGSRDALSTREAGGRYRERIALLAARRYGLAWHRAFCLPQASKRSQKSSDVQEIDISQQPGALQEYGVMTTPSLVLNGRLEFSGVSKAKKLIKRLKKMQRHTS